MSVPKAIMADGEEPAAAAAAPTAKPRGVYGGGASAAAAAAAAASASDNHLTKATLSLYYQKLCPLGPMYDWITYGSPDATQRAKREYCVTLRTAQNDEVFVRYNCCATRDDFKRLMKRDGDDDLVLKLDLGPVYSADVRAHVTASSTNFRCVERELVFDIDMDEYDKVRTCCSGKTVCRKCFRFLTSAVKVIDSVMREDFGFKHILYVFSGRRGVHCWVCDRRARELSDRARTAVAEYLNIDVNALDDRTKTPDIALQHPTVRRSTELLMREFPELLETQEIFDDPVQRGNLVRKFGSQQFSVPAGTPKDTQSQWYARNSHKHARFMYRVCFFSKRTHSLFNAFLFFLRRDAVVAESAAIRAKKSKDPEASKGATAAQRIVLHHLYPRLDVEVSKHMNHLLKAPFCIHPATGKVCVPLDINTVDSFDPDTVPTLSKLLAELNAVPAATLARHNTPSALTSLAPYIAFFEDFVKNVLVDEATGKDEVEGKEIGDLF
jgi:DNA primase small subunit